MITGGAPAWVVVCCPSLSVGWLPVTARATGKIYRPEHYLVNDGWLLWDRSVDGEDAVKGIARRMMHRAVLVAVLVVALGASVGAQDDQEIADLRARAEAGDAEAQFNLGYAYRRGFGVPQNGPEAVAWYRRAYEQGGTISIQSAQEVGFIYRDGDGVPVDYAEAAAWYRVAAEQGDASSQYNLGFMYDTGAGLPQDDAEAARWFRLAAEQGVLLAQGSLGFKYANGRGVPQADAEAVRWYRLAAEQGNAFAQFYLGLSYSNGRGVPQDDAEAVRWYRLAAEQGQAGALNNLGLAYGTGRGVPQDYVAAHMWYNLAASRSTGEDRELSVRNRDLVAAQMTPEDLSEAQRRAREWDAASRLFPTDDSTRTSSENPSVDSPDFEYGEESELRGVKTVYVDTGFELKSRNDIVNTLRADTALAVVDRPQETDVVLVFRWDGRFGTIAKGYAIIGNRLVWEFEDARGNILQRLPSTNFARNFLELIK